MKNNFIPFKNKTYLSNNASSSYFNNKYNRYKYNNINNKAGDKYHYNNISNNLNAKNKKIIITKIKYEPLRDYIDNEINLMNLKMRCKLISHKLNRIKYFISEDDYNTIKKTEKKKFYFEDFKSQPEDINLNLNNNLKFINNNKFIEDLNVDSLENLNFENELKEIINNNFEKRENINFTCDNNFDVNNINNNLPKDQNENENNDIKRFDLNNEINNNNIKNKDGKDSKTNNVFHVVSLSIDYNKEKKEIKENDEDMKEKEVFQIENQTNLNLKKDKKENLGNVINKNNFDNYEKLKFLYENNMLEDYNKILINLDENELNSNVIKNIENHKENEKQDNDFNEIDDGQILKKEDAMDKIEYNNFNHFEDNLDNNQIDKEKKGNSFTKENESNNNNIETNKNKDFIKYNINNDIKNYNNKENTYNKYSDSLTKSGNIINSKPINEIPNIKSMTKDTNNNNNKNSNKNPYNNSIKQKYKKIIPTISLYQYQDVLSNDKNKNRDIRSNSENNNILNLKKNIGNINSNRIPKREKTYTKIEIKDEDKLLHVLKLNNSEDNLKVKKTEEEIEMMIGKDKEKLKRYGPIRRNIEMIKNIEAYKKQGIVFPGIRKERKLVEAPLKYCYRFREDPQKFYTESLCDSMYEALDFKINKK